MKLNNKWFLVDDNYISNNVKFTCTTNDANVPYLLIYKKTVDVMPPSPSSIIDIPNVSPVHDLIIFLMTNV